MTQARRIRMVAIGDGMVEHAGVGMPLLAAQLQAAWPNVPFEVINQGVTGSRVGHGLWRLTREYEQAGRQLTPIVTLQPDVVLLESFAYTNAADGVIGDEGLRHLREMHWRIVSTIREKTAADIVFVVSVAPDGERFLETSPAYVHTPGAIRRWMAKDRRIYLEEAAKMAQSWELPIANAFQASMDAAARGTPLARFISATDWLHPSEEGHRLTAGLIVEALRQHKLLEPRLDISA